MSDKRQTCDKKWKKEGVPDQRRAAEIRPELWNTEEQPKPTIEQLSKTEQSEYRRSADPE